MFPALSETLIAMGSLDHLIPDALHRLDMNLTRTNGLMYGVFYIPIYVESLAYELEYVTLINSPDQSGNLLLPNSGS